MLPDQCHILYVDDEYNNIVVFENSFFKYFTVYTASSAQEALSVLKGQEVHLLITDQRMPGMSGLELLEVVSEQYPDLIKMILTAYSDLDVIMQAINKCGIFQYILKPWDRRDLKMIIDNAWARYRLKAENKQLINDLRNANLQLEEKVRQRTLQLDERNQKLVELNVFKDKLFSIISHDLKTPLLSLEVYLDMLTQLHGNLSPDKIKAYGIKIHIYLKELQNLLDSLLQWSLLEKKAGIDTMQPIDLHSIIRNNISLYKAFADQKGIAIEYLPDNALFTIMGDINMMNVILRNLLSNAIKYTKRKGTVRIIVKDNDPFVQVVVTDTGVGIPEEDLKTLFSPSEYKSTKGTDMESGTGLGLKLCNELTSRQGGTITVETKLGQGSAFTLNIPKAGKQEPHLTV